MSFEVLMQRRLTTLLMFEIHAAFLVLWLV